MNGMLYLAVEQGILDRNCLRDINYRQFTYKSEDTDVFPYTEEERLLIINPWTMKIFILWQSNLTTT